MGNMNTYRDKLNQLRDQAQEMTSTVLSLGNLLTEEANQLSQEDEVSHLRVLQRNIEAQLQRMMQSESSASYAHTRIGLIVSLGMLGVAAFTGMVSKDNRLPSHILQSLSSKKNPSFGNIQVCIGSDGLPDGVEVVSISRLARESNLTESEVINDLGKRGYLLFSGGEFSILINNIIDGVREGRFHLPMPKENLRGFCYRAVRIVMRRR